MFWFSGNYCASYLLRLIDFIARILTIRYSNPMLTRQAVHSTLPAYFLVKLQQILAGQNFDSAKKRVVKNADTSQQALVSNEGSLLHRSALLECWFEALSQGKANFSALIKSIAPYLGDVSSYVSFMRDRLRRLYKTCILKADNTCAFAVK